jgi:hypothetical protein
LKKRIVVLVLLIFLLSVGTVFASSNLFDEYGIRKNVVQKMSVGDVELLEEKNNVLIDKKWTISFNREFELDEIFAMSIKKIMF